jgi:hypothetical protein
MFGLYKWQEISLRPDQVSASEELCYVDKTVKIVIVQGKRGSREDTWLEIAWNSYGVNINCIIKGRLDSSVQV